MKAALLVINAVVGGALLTLALAVLSLLFLMFSVGEELGRQEGLFGTLYFEAAGTPGELVNATMGVNNPAGLVAIFVAFTVLVALAQVAFRMLKRYRDDLIRERSQAQAA